MSSKQGQMLKANDMTTDSLNQFLKWDEINLPFKSIEYWKGLIFHFHAKFNYQ